MRQLLPLKRPKPAPLPQGPSSASPMAQKPTMICSPVNRARFICPSLVEAGFQLRVEENVSCRYVLNRALSNHLQKGAGAKAFCEERNTAVCFCIPCRYEVESRGELKAFRHNRAHLTRVDPFLSIMFRQEANV